jgi:hypothetical protein
MTSEEEKEPIIPCKLIKGEQLHLLYVTFKNGYFFSLYPKNEPKLGTMSLTLPIIPQLGLTRETRKMLESPTGSKKGVNTVTVLGSRNELFVKAMSEKLSLATQGMIYFSLNFEENNEELYREGLTLIDRFLADVKENQ